VLKNVQIVNTDYKFVLTKAKRNDFVYFDPPYYPINKTSSFTSYTKENFLENEQVELRDVFFQLHKRGCFVMLSNSDTRFIHELYSSIDFFKIKKVNASRIVNAKTSGRGKIKELVITNY
jgi:DNA adenine methylase